MSPAVLFVLLLLGIVGWRQVLSLVTALTVALACLGIVYVLIEIGVIGVRTTS